MKTSKFYVALMLWAIFTLRDGQTATWSAQPVDLVPAPTAYRVVDKGSNHRKWQRETFEKAPDGRIVTRIHQYTELASGMNYKNANGQWVESVETVEAFSQGAVAAHGQYQVIFANNLNSYAAIDLHTPDGKRLRSNILGLGYYDSSTGHAVLVAQVKDSYGELVADNQVLYGDAFDGVKADVHYIYKKGGFEQDVVLLEQPPTPESFGMNPATTKLEVFTEFLSPPQETITVNMDDTGAAQDEAISWGVTQIGRGRAFDLSGENDASGVAVEKRYITAQGRKILVEMVPLKAVAGSLNRLPLQSSIDKKRPMLAAAEKDIIPDTRKQGLKPKPMKLAALKSVAKGYVLDYITLNVSQTNFTFQGDTTYFISGNVNLTGVTTIEGGTVIKYDTNNACSINVLGTVNCLTDPYRPAVFTSANDGTIGEDVSTEGGGGAACTGTLALHVQNNWSADFQYVWVYDQDWNTVVDGEGGPEISSGNYANYSFTIGLGAQCYFYAYDADWNPFGGGFNPTLSNGTITVDSDGSVTYSESGSALCTPPPPPPPPVVVGLALANGGSLHDVRFKNLGLGIDSVANYTVTDAQFLHCGAALKTEGANLYAGNILMGKVGIGFSGQSFATIAENLTFDQGTHLTDIPTGNSSSLALTNSLLTAVTDNGNATISTNYVAWLDSNAGVYQMVGAGSYYLADDSPYRNGGSAGIDPWLLDDLRQKTTYPPIVHSNTTITSAISLSPQAQRDTDTPDLGYHYAPLDYCFGGVNTSSNLTIAAGTAIGWFQLPGSGGPGFGISLANSGIASFTGTAMQPCNFVKYSVVQEGGNGLWEDRGWLAGIIADGSYDPAVMPKVMATFTRFSHLCNDNSPLRDYNNAICMVAINSEFYGGFGGYDLDYTFTNCLFYRAYFWQGTADPAYSFETYRDIYQNCTFYGSNLEFAHWEPPPYWKVNIENCAFDSTALNLYSTGSGLAWLTSDYNATNNCTYNENLLPGSHNLKPTGGFNWQQSWLGDFYLPTGSALINVGSTNANLIGLYHFTTQTDQAKEATSKVDIGYHYVAVDENGNPIDTDGDGTADYLEDSNGDGIYELGDFGYWKLSPFGLTGAGALQVFTPLH